MIKRILCMSLFLLCGCFGVRGQATFADKVASEYNKVNYSSEEHQISKRGRNVVQTADGYIWVATYDGLARFDGLSFTIYNTTTSPIVRNNLFRRLYVDHADSALWAGTADGLFKIKKGVWTLYDKKDGLPESDVESLLIDSKGRFWVGTVGGLCYMDKKTGRFLSEGLPQNLSKGSISAILEDKKQRLWFSSSKGLMVMEAGKTISIREGGGLLRSDVVYSLNLGEGDAVWVGAQDGLYRFDSPSKSVRFGSESGFSDTRIAVAYTDSKKRLWAGSFRDNRVWNPETSRFEAFSANAGFDASSITGITEDLEGNLWLSTYSDGLWRLSPQKFTGYAAAAGIGSYINAVCRHPDGTMYFSTQTSFMALKDGQIKKVEWPGIPKAEIKDFMIDAQGRFWFCANTALEVLSPGGGLKTMGVKDGLPDAYVRVAYQAKNGDIWLGTNEGLCRVSPDLSKKQVFFASKKNNHLSNDYILSIYEDREGNIWVGTKNGINRIEPEGRISSFLASADKSSNVVFQACQDVNGVIWFGSNMGLIRIKDDEAIVLDARQGLPTDAVYHVIPDKFGYLWLTTYKGLVKVDRKLLNKAAEGLLDKIPYKIYDKTDGLPSKDFKANTRYAATDDGLFYLPMYGGLALVDPGKIPTNATPPPVAIKDAMIDDSLAMPEADVIVAPPGQHRITIEFAALTFIAPEKTRFKYKLEGFDNDWQGPTSDRTASYTNLPYGEYTFSVIACNNDGVWNLTGASIKIIKQSRFYERPGFYALLALALMLCGAGVYQWRLENIKQRNKLLQNMVEERTEEIMQQKNSLEKSYQNIKLLSEIGKNIASNLSVNDIIQTVYDNVNALMDASVFLIGTADQAGDLLIHSIERGEGMPDQCQSLSEQGSLAVWCFISQKSIFIADMPAEYAAMFPQTPPAYRKEMNSAIYLPLISKASCMGVIGVKSPKLRAYSDYHLNILQNIATYTAIALDNAEIHDKSERLLLNILPAETAEELKEKGFTEPKSYKMVTVLFTDFNGFTKISESMSPEKIVRELEYCFSAFDAICEKHGLEKIKTMGDAYMCAGGIPTPNDTNPVDAVKAGLEMQEFMEGWRIKKEATKEKAWELRVGIHTGQVVAGVIGRKKFVYDIWGDTVNTASRMETAGLEGMVNISGETFSLVKKHFDCEYRGKIHAKHKGEIDMYFVKAL